MMIIFHFIFKNIKLKVKKKEKVRILAKIVRR